MSMSPKFVQKNEITPVRKRYSVRYLTGLQEKIFAYFCSGCYHHHAHSSVGLKRL